MSTSAIANTTFSSAIDDKPANTSLGQYCFSHDVGQTVVENRDFFVPHLQEVDRSEFAKVFGVGKLQVALLLQRGRAMLCVRQYS